MDNLLFAKLNFLELDKDLAASEILKVDNSLWFWDEYRATSMLPLMTKESMSGIDGSSNNRPGMFQWLPYTPNVLINWFENEIFPWMGSKTRIMALMTRPNFSNNEHIDCDKNQIGTRQHKFRIVLKGNTDSLYFKTRTGNIPAPHIDGPFLMDGGWPHGMTNSSSEFKLTIAAGAPWIGNSSYDNLEMLLDRNDFQLPENYESYLKIKS